MALQTLDQGAQADACARVAEACLRQGRLALEWGKKIPYRWDSMGLNRSSVIIGMSGIMNDEIQIAENDQDIIYILQEATDKKVWTFAGGKR